MMQLRLAVPDLTAALLVRKLTLERLRPASGGYRHACGNAPLYGRRRLSMAAAAQYQGHGAGPAAIPGRVSHFFQAGPLTFSCNDLSLLDNQG